MIRVGPEDAQLLSVVRLFTVHARRVQAVISDPNAVGRVGLRTVLESDPSIAVVGEAGEWAETEAAVRALDSNVIVLASPADTPAPWAAVERLRSVANRPINVVLIGDLQPAAVLGAIQAGAKGVVSPATDVESLIAIVRAAATGSVAIAADAAGALQLAVGTVVDPPDEPSPVQGLSERQRQILRLIAQGYADAEVARQLCIAEVTVRSHVHHLLTRLNARNRAHAVATAYRLGIVRLNDC
jgi:DNA-binding NarL/FixJ family response regulator